MSNTEIIMNILLFLLLSSISGICLKIGSNAKEYSENKYTWGKSLLIGFIYSTSFYLILFTTLFIVKHFIDKK